MASNQGKYTEQFQLLQERWPQESKDKILSLLQKYNGDVDQVHACLFHKEYRVNRLSELEARYGAALTVFQQAYPSSQTLYRPHLLKTLAHFSGDFDLLKKALEKREDKPNESQISTSAVSRTQQREELKSKYAVQLAELASAGVNVNCPCVLAKLDKHRGNVEKVVEFMKRQKQKKVEVDSLSTTYADQVAQLEADGMKIKNKRLLMQLLEKSNGDVDVVKRWLAERNEQKHQTKSSANNTMEQDEIIVDDLDHLKELRSAGVHGNPVKILKIFHECNDSIENTIARLAKEREECEQKSEKRTEERILLAEIHDAYLSINNRDDWPHDIQQVYLDGNSMMFVVDSLRRLCLNRNGKKTERAIAEITATWNEHMHIPNVDLIFDSTRQLESVGSVKVSSAQPEYKTTDDMLIEIARRSENEERNERTIVVTSDRALAIQLKREGCLLVKSYQWFAHCMMVLTPDLIRSDERMNLTTTSTGVTKKIHYDLDELVHRIAKIDI